MTKDRLIVGEHVGEKEALGGDGRSGHLAQLVSLLLQHVSCCLRNLKTCAWCDVGGGGLVVVLSVLEGFMVWYGVFGGVWCFKCYGDKTI